MNLKPAAAFAAGLWIGAVVVVAIGAFDFHSWQWARSATPTIAQAEITKKADETQSLRQEQARLTAENQRLRETVTELKSNLDARIAVEGRRWLRRVPFRETGPTDQAAAAWIAEAVTSGNVQALPRLEAAAQQNNPLALEALAQMAERDGGEALTRVWSSDSLSFANKVTATRYLAATMEVNPHAEEILRSLFAAPATDARLLYAAVDGIANPGPPAMEAQDPTVPSPVPVEPDFSRRVQVLDELGASVTDEDLLSHIELGREQLMKRWSKAAPAAP
jgi:cell division protein FtsB